VLLDHGLYRTLDEQFRYCRLSLAGLLIWNVVSS
jgi:hypothetical protein